MQMNLLNDMETITISFDKVPGVGFIRLIVSFICLCVFFFSLIQQIFMEHLLCVRCVLATQNRAADKFAF